MSTSTEPTVVVAGYDGSPAALAAVERGIDRVGSTGQLVVVIAHQPPADYAGGYYQATIDDSLAVANTILTELKASCGRLSTVNWEPELVQGSAGAAIARVAETRHADEIAIGTRGHGRFRVALGSVATDVLHRATCPVLVIPQRMVEGNLQDSRKDAAVV